jgi:hypothetical protein
MLKVSQAQLINRRDSLPLNLREALSSEKNADILWQICEAQHIPKEKIYTVATLAGDVILGFVHFDDLAKSIRADLGVAPEIAQTVSDEINRKIFAPIRLNLEKVYAPPSGETIRLEDKFIGAKEEPETGTPTVADILKPKPAETFKIVDMGQAAAPVFAEIPANKEEKTLVSGVPEGPVIIHKEAELKPLSGSRKSLGGLFGFLRGRQEKPEAEAVKAQVEMGGFPKNGIEPAKKEAKTAEPKIRVIHYTDIPETVNPFPKAIAPEAETGFKIISDENPFKIKEEPEKGGKEAVEKEIEPPENLLAVSETEPLAVNKVDFLKPIDMEPVIIHKERGFFGLFGKKEKSPKETEKEETIKVPENLLMPATAEEIAAEKENIRKTEPPKANPPERGEIIDLNVFK